LATKRLSVSRRITGISVERTIPVSESNCYSSWFRAILNQLLFVFESLQSEPEFKNNRFWVYYASLTVFQGLFINLTAFEAFLPPTYFIFRVLVTKLLNYCIDTFIGIFKFYC